MQRAAEAIEQGTPGFYYLGGPGPGAAYPVAAHQDFSALVTQENPARPGEIRQSSLLVHRAAADSWVAYTPDLPAANAIGYASRRAPNSFKVWLRPQGHVFDWGALRWCQFYASPPDGCIDAEMVALHEFGHVQGLGHIEDAPDPGRWLDSIMHELARSKPKAA